MKSKLQEGKLFRTVNREHKIHVCVLNSSLPRLDAGNIDFRDFYVQFVLLDAFKSDFCRTNKDLGLTRYELGVLLLLYSFYTENILTASGKGKLKPQLLCKNDIYRLYPFCHNARLNETLKSLNKQGHISFVVEQSKRAEQFKRHSITLNRTGIKAAGQFLDKYRQYISLIYQNK